MKIAIIGGGGTLGANSAFTITQTKVADEIVLIDARENMAKAHQMDLDQALSHLSSTQIISGGWEQAKDADLVILVFGSPAQTMDIHKQGGVSRMNRLEKNSSILLDVSEKIRYYAPKSIILNAVNPLDVINTMVQRWTGFSKEKIIGLALNDTTRFQWAISRILEVETSAVEATVLGEHGEERCHLFSQIYVHGQRTDLTAFQKRHVLDLQKQWFEDFASLQSGRTSGWLSAVNIAYMVEAISRENKRPFPCSILNNENISIAQPVQIGRHGVIKTTDIEMTDEEKKQMEKGYNKVKNDVEKAINNTGESV